MNVKIVINAKETTKDDIRAFVQMIREWELKTPKSTIVGVLFDTDPKITSEQAKAIFEGIFPEGFFVDTHDPAVSLYTNIDAVEPSKGSIIRLGTRGITVGGDLIGTCEEISLSIGEASNEEIKKLEEAEAIVLIRMRQW